MVDISRWKHIKNTIQLEKLLHILETSMLDSVLLSILVGNILKNKDMGVEVYIPEINSYKGSPTFELRGITSKVNYLEDKDLFRLLVAEDKINKELRNV